MPHGLIHKFMYMFLHQHMQAHGHGPNGELIVSTTWSNVPIRTCNCVGSSAAFWRTQKLCKAKICKKRLILWAYQDVVRLNISMNDWRFLFSWHPFPLIHNL